MGCPNGQCAGYELTDNLTFATSATWTPIGIPPTIDAPSQYFSATLDGAGYTITGLTVTSTGQAGLFLSLTRGAVVRDLGLINASISGVGGAGILAVGAANGSLLTGVYASGGSVASAYTSFGNRAGAGGLVGNIAGHLYAAWSTASISTSGNNLFSSISVGGLVGNCVGCHLAASYAAGAVTSTTNNVNLGGLAGRVYDGSGDRASVLADSYCNPDAAGLTACIGAQSGAAVTSTPYTAAQLQAPTGYTGIYQDWNIDLDLDDRPDYPWNFGTTTTYPVLNSPAQRAALTPVSPDSATVDYDANDNGLIDIANRDQLHAIRWDLDGNGRLEGDPFTARDYGRAFPNRDPAAATRMGCPGGACAGYELTADLGPAATWTPIDGFFNATLDGRYHDLSINIYGGRGMFGGLGDSATVRNLRLLVSGGAVSVGSTITAGGLAAFASRGSVISAVAVSSQVEGLASARSQEAGYGGLVGTAYGTIQASYAQNPSIRLRGTGYNQTSTGGGGGLVGKCLGCTITASYVVSDSISAVSANAQTYARLGGLVGYVESGPTHGTSTITDSYCYATSLGDSRQLDCIGHQTGTPAVTVASKTRAELREPTGYTGIYQNWNLDLDGNGDPDDPWIFPGPPTGGHTHAWTYPTHRNPDADHDHEHDHDDEHDDHDDEHDDDRAARPPADDTDYNPAADHPEIYANDRYEMSAACQVHRNADGEPTGSTITFNLGTYEGEVLLALTLWNGDHFASYERMDADHPTLDRNGQTATVQVATTPAQTRFLLDGRPHGLRTNLLLGYADCHTDDPGAEQPAPTPTPTPAPPKVYRSDQHEMTATCNVTPAADGNPTTSQITFDLGEYEAEVTLHLSLWNGEYYATFESQGLTQPDLERNGQTATVTITTDPAETVFLLNTAAKPTRNLLLGHADCHTAGG